MIKVIFLGTSAMQPTKERNPSAIYVNYETETLLFDCGEGTQRQMRLAGLKPTKITRVILSHYHGDHVLGMPGLLSNLNANEYNGTLEVYGPQGIEEFVKKVRELARIKNDELKIKTIELKEGNIIETDKFVIIAKKLNHSIHSYGFSFIEKYKRKINLEYTSKFGLKQHPLLGELQKGNDITWNGKKITAKKATIIVPGKILSLIFDTALSQSCLDIAKDADLLICESTFIDEEKQKAAEYKHLTASQAGEIAKKAKVKKLILTHFSQRYKDIEIAKKEAQKYFKKVECAEDFKEVIL